MSQGRRPGTPWPPWPPPCHALAALACLGCRSGAPWPSGPFVGFVRQPVQRVCPRRAGPKASKSRLPGPIGFLLLILSSRLRFGARCWGGPDPGQQFSTPTALFSTATGARQTMLEICAMYARVFLTASIAEGTRNSSTACEPIVLASCR